MCETCRLELLNGGEALKGGWFGHDCNPFSRSKSTFCYVYKYKTYSLWSTYVFDMFELISIDIIITHM